MVARLIAFQEQENTINPTTTTTGLLQYDSPTEYGISNRVGFLDGVGMKVFGWSRSRCFGDGLLFNNWDPQMGMVIFFTHLTRWKK